MQSQELLLWLLLAVRFPHTIAQPLYTLCRSSSSARMSKKPPTAQPIPQACAVAATVLSCYACAGVADDDESPTNASQTIGTTAATAVFSSKAGGKACTPASDRIIMVPELVPINMAPSMAKLRPR